MPAYWLSDDYEPYVHEQNAIIFWVNSVADYLAAYAHVTNAILQCLVAVFHGMPLPAVPRVVPLFAANCIH